MRLISSGVAMESFTVLGIPIGESVHRLKDRFNEGTGNTQRLKREAQVVAHVMTTFR